MPTSIQLPPELERRVEAAARSTGKSPHAFMLEAVEGQTAEAEWRQHLVDAALSAEEEALKSGAVFDAAEVHQAMRTRAKGR